MKILIIESTLATPHTETAIEIGFKHLLLGDRVLYCPMFLFVSDLIWGSNINGSINNGMRHSAIDWFNYIKSLINNKFTIDLDSGNINENYLTEDILDNIFNFKYDSFNFGNLVKSNITEITSSYDFDWHLKTNKLLIETIANNALKAYNYAVYHLVKHKPDYVVFFNGRTTTSYPIYLAAKKNELKSIIHERGSSKEKYSFSFKPIQYIDSFQHEILKHSEGRSHYQASLSAATFFNRQKYSKSKGFAITSFLQNHKISPKLDKLHEKYLCFFPSSNFETFFMPEQDLSLGLGSQIEAAKTLNKIAKDLSIQFVIRMHPNTPEYEHNYYESLSSYNTLIIEPKSSVSSYLLAENALRCFSYGSTISWELMFNDISCGLLGLSAGTNQPGVIELRNETMCYEFIENPLLQVNKEFAIKYGDYFHNYGEMYDFYSPTTLFSGEFFTDL